MTRPVGQDRLHADHLGTHRAVAHHVQAAGVGGHHATDSGAVARAARSTGKARPAPTAAACTRASGTPAPAVTWAATGSTGSSRASREVLSTTGRVGPAPAPPVRGTAAADQAGVAALRHDRHPVGGAGPHGGRYLFGGGRPHHGQGRAAEAAGPVLLVGRPHCPDRSRHGPARRRRSALRPAQASDYVGRWRRALDMQPRATGQAMSHQGEPMSRSRTGHRHRRGRGGRRPAQPARQAQRPGPGHVRRHRGDRRTTGRRPRRAGRGPLRGGAGVLRRAGLGDVPGDGRVGAGPGFRRQSRRRPSGPPGGRRPGRAAPGRITNRPAGGLHLDRDCRCR